MCLSVCGQQLPQYTQFQKNQYLINPGATGAHDMFNLSLGGRMQWVGLSNAPNTSYIYLSSPARKIRNAFINRTYGKVKRNNKTVKQPKMRSSNLTQGVGGHLLVDRFGAFQTLKVAGSYAVHIRINRLYTMSFGTSVGLSSHTFMPDKAQVLSSLNGTGINDAVYNTQASTGSQNILDVDVGIYFHGGGFFAGLAMTNMTRDFVRFGNLNTNFYPIMHRFGCIGYKFELNNRLDFTPAVLVKYVQNAPVSLEANFLFDFSKQYWLGFTYRHMDAVAFLAGTTISEKFRIGYSYDLSVSRLFGYNSGGHELVISYVFGDKRRSFSRI